MAFASSQVSSFSTGCLIQLFLGSMSTEEVTLLVAKETSGTVLLPQECSCLTCYYLFHHLTPPSLVFLNRDKFLAAIKIARKFILEVITELLYLSQTTEDFWSVS